eukprot:MONOS_1257.1-p1 / transcript=MONOS_1257.1 / gene=MONOS_1257 / organism=Monocercomonoides_exilis_PA203 / gene_product=unspecified product / transcript_product=unspecified product / location=Mono_scaffold00021:152874-155395(+) / protein_length=820 / sequence_SO=supercontig / SO=protein_coding / is_pseudo=false
MLVAEAIQRHLLGRNFSFNPNFFPFCPRCVWLASLFSDEMKPGTRYQHPFSIQHLMELGENYGKAQGQWFAPGTIANVYKSIITRHVGPQLGMAVYIPPAGFNTIYISDVLRLLHSPLQQPEKFPDSRFTTPSCPSCPIIGCMCSIQSREEKHRKMEEEKKKKILQKLSEKEKQETNKKESEPSSSDPSDSRIDCQKLKFPELSPSQAASNTTTPSSVTLSPRPSEQEGSKEVNEKQETKQETEISDSSKTEMENEIKNENTTESDVSSELSSPQQSPSQQQSPSSTPTSFISSHSASSEKLSSSAPYSFGSVSRSSSLPTSSGPMAASASVSSAASTTESPSRAVLILFPTRLGLTKIPLHYTRILSALFQLPSFCGIAGGHPSSAHFFFGCVCEKEKDDKRERQRKRGTESVLYLDPHVTREAEEVKMIRVEHDEFWEKEREKENKIKNFDAVSPIITSAPSPSSPSSLSSTSPSSASLPTSPLSKSMSPSSPSDPSCNSSSPNSPSANIQSTSSSSTSSTSSTASSPSSGNTAYPHSSSKCLAANSFHPPSPSAIHSMPIKAMDPSMCLGFLIKSDEELFELKKQVEFIFTVQSAIRKKEARERREKRRMAKKLEREKRREKEKEKGQGQVEESQEADDESLENDSVTDESLDPDEDIPPFIFFEGKESADDSFEQRIKVKEGKRPNKNKVGGADQEKCCKRKAPSLSEGLSQDIQGQLIDSVPSDEEMSDDGDDSQKRSRARLDGKNAENEGAIRSGAEGDMSHASELGGDDSKDSYHFEITGQPSSFAAAPYLDGCEDDEDDDAGEDSFDIIELT